MKNRILLSLLVACMLPYALFAQKSISEKKTKDTTGIILSKEIVKDEKASPNFKKDTLKMGKAMSPAPASRSGQIDLLPEDPGNPGNPGDPGDPYPPIDPPSGPGATIDAGRTLSSLNVSGTGGASFNIPFTLPPGIGNVVPQIGLAYSSQAGNGIAGYGWNITGLSTISRIPGTQFHDGQITGVNFNANDRFSLDGQRLLLKSGTYGANASEYQTENYSNLKIVAHGTSPFGSGYGPEYFEVFYPDGSKAYYGINSNSRTPSDYAITYSDNPLGVRINYNYQLMNNILYIAQITYGSIGTGNAPNQINFYYSYANRAEHVYVGGTSFLRDQLLNKISIVANGSNFRNYKLTYSAMATLNYQRIASIQEFDGSETRAFEPISFGYSSTGDAISTNSISSLSLSGIAANNSQVVTADFTGNGAMDFLLYPNAKNKFWAFYDPEQGSPYMQLGYEVNTGYFRELFPVSWLTYNNKILAGQGIALVKDNGYNGLKFEVYSSGTVAPVYYQYERQWTNVPLGQGYYSDCDNQYHEGNPVDMDFVSGDFNGDGLTDIISIAKSTNVIVYEYMENTNPNDPGYPYPWAQRVSVLPPPGGGWCVQQYGQSASSAYFINLDRRITSDYITSLGQFYPYYTNGDKLLTADVNGDGKTDIIHLRNGMMSVYTLHPNNYLQQLWQTYDSRITTNYQPLLGDYNGDGKMDIMFPTGNNSLFATFMSTGTTFQKTEQYQPFSNVAGTWDGTPGVETLRLYYLIPNDIDGDGKTDMIFAQTTTRNNNAYGTVNLTVYHNSGPNAYAQSNFGYGISSSSYTNLRHYPIPVFLNPDRMNQKLEFGFMSDNSVSLFKFQKDLRTEAQLTSIYQDGIFHNIEYKGLIADAYYTDIPVYTSGYEQTYPYVDLSAIPSMNVVTKITKSYGQSSLSQSFGYGKAVSHLGGLGFMGFGELTRSNWYVNSYDPNKSYTISIQDPFLRGANVRTFTTKYNYLNPAVKDFSYTGTAAAAPAADGAGASDYMNRSDTHYSTILLGNKVFVNAPISTSTKDMVSSTFKTSAIEYDGYYNVTKLTENINGNGSSIAEATFDNNLSAYYVGRQLSKTITLNNGSDSYTSLEECSYSGSLPSQVRKKGNNTPFVTEDIGHDGFGNVISKTLTVPGGAQRSSSMQYDASGRFLIQDTDADGMITSYVPDQATGNLLSKTNPFGQTESYLYDVWGRKITETDYQNINTHRTYQKNGTHTETIEIDDEGRYRYTIMDPEGHMLESREKNVLGQVIGKSMQYDVYGRIVAESQPAQPGSYYQWNTTSYDEFDRPTQIVSYTGKTTTMTYSGLSTSASDGTKTVVTTKNAFGNISSIQDPGGTINYAYFANGNMKLASYGGMNQVVEQDGWGRKTKLTDPSAGVYEFEYDGFGQPKKEITPKGVTEYTYDGAGKLLTKKITGDATNLQYSYNYDNYTKLLMSLSLTNADGNDITYTNTYDGQRRILTSTEDNLHARFVKSFTYDGFGRIATETYEAKDKSTNIVASKTVQMQYQNGELLQTTLQGSGQILWKINSLDTKGMLSTALQGNALKTTYQYDSYGLPQQNTTEKISGTPVSLMSLGFGFDAQRGLLTSRSNSVFNWSENFSYDNLNRLTGFNNNDGNRTQTYDNRGRISNNSELGDYVYDSGSYKQTELNYLTTAADAYYQSRNPQQISYNAFKSPVEIIEPGHERISFQYNGALGRSHMYFGDEQADKMQRRFRRHYSEDGIVEITNDLQTGTTSFVFYLAGNAYNAPAIFKEIHNGSGVSQNLYFLQRDQIGSIVLITNDQGDAVEHRQFDAWGNIVRLTDGFGNTLASFSIIDRGFTGHEHLLGVGLIHMNGRLYDPKLHRFLSPDRYVQDPYTTQNFNRYAYVLNNPLIFSDPNGEFIHLIIGALVGGVVNWIAHGAKFTWKGLAYFGVGAAAGALGAGVASGVGAALSGGGSFAAGFVNSSLSIGSGFFTGAVVGAAGGFTGGFTGGLGNGLVDGKSLGSALMSGLKGGAIGAVSGALAGGIASGIKAAKEGTNFWTGEGKIYEKGVTGILADGSDEVYYSDKSAADFSFSHEELRRLSVNTNGLHADGTVPDGMTFNKATGFIMEGKDEILGVTTRTGFFKKSIDVYLSKAAFVSRAQLYMTMHHEYMHAYFINHGIILANDGHDVIRSWHAAQLSNWAPRLLKFNSYYYSYLQSHATDTFSRYGFKAVPYLP